MDVDPTVSRCEIGFPMQKFVSIVSYDNCDGDPIPCDCETDGSSAALEDSPATSSSQQPVAWSRWVTAYPRLVLVLVPNFHQDPRLVPSEARSGATTTTARPRLAWSVTDRNTESSYTIPSGMLSSAPGQELAATAGPQSKSNCWVLSECFPSLLWRWLSKHQARPQLRPSQIIRLQLPGYKQRLPDPAQPPTEQWHIMEFLRSPAQCSPPTPTPSLISFLLSQNWSTNLNF